jgi:hypothetical protein
MKPAKIANPAREHAEHPRRAIAVDEVAALRRTAPGQEHRPDRHDVRDDEDDEAPQKTHWGMSVDRRRHAVAGWSNDPTCGFSRCQVGGHAFATPACAIARPLGHRALAVGVDLSAAEFHVDSVSRLDLMGGLSSVVPQKISRTPEISQLEEVRTLARRMFAALPHPSPSATMHSCGVRGTPSQSPCDRGWPLRSHSVPS